MCLNLSDYPLKIDCYICKFLYINLVITRNQQPILDTQKVMKKEFKQNTKEIYQVSSEKKREKEKTIIEQE